jgi:hypothetical protein
MEKRYQVFVSSTYADLEEERQEVMQALLELDCIPSGMELFPAASEDQWTLIQKVIDDCDYYLVIVAGRYGSVGPDGTSYTEMEYRYAVEHNKPIISFLHQNPGTLRADRSEESAEGRSKLEGFRTLVQKRMCRMWDSPSDLGSKVSRSLVKLIKAHPAVGWIRGDAATSEAAVRELLRLRRRIDELENELSEARLKAPDGASTLAQGQDTILLRYSFRATGVDIYREEYASEVELTWDDVFGAVSPLMLQEATERSIFNELNSLIEMRTSETLKNSIKSCDTFDGFAIDRHDFNTIKVQLRALGLIAQSTKTRSVHDKHTYWSLTPYGELVMTRLRAVRKGDGATHTSDDE